MEQAAMVVKKDYGTLDEDGTWAERIAYVIIKKEIFDLEDNPGGFKTVHGLIAEALLEGYTKYEQIQYFQEVEGKVRRNLENGIKLAYERAGVKIYKVIEDGTKHIQIVTCLPEYKQAEEGDYRRRRRNAMNVLGHFHNYGMGVMHQSKLPFHDAELKRIENRFKKEEEDENQ